MVAAFGMLIAAAGASVGLTTAAEVTLDRREIRLGDIADLRGLDPALRSRLAPRVVAVIPRGRSRAVLTREALAGLARRAAPGIEVRTARETASVTFQLVEAGPSHAARLCSELARGMVAGEALSRDDVVPASCGEGASAASFVFDRRNRVLRAAGDLPAGTYLGRISLSSDVAVEAGDKLTLVATAGPVRVAREVVALQPGRAGGKVFVKDADGNVTSAPLSVQPKGNRP